MLEACEIASVLKYYVTACSATNGHIERNRQETNLS